MSSYREHHYYRTSTPPGRCTGSGTDLTEIENKISDLEVKIEACCSAPTLVVQNLAGEDKFIAKQLGE